MTILNNDPDTSEATYTFSVTGTGTVPDILVRQGATDLASGTGTYDFGLVMADGNNGSASANVTFTIHNLGGADLAITSVALTAGDAGDFDLTNGTASPIPAGGSTTFTVRFDPLTSGSKSATVTIVSNDPDTPTYTFQIIGIGALPNIHVVQGVTDLTDGVGTYDFGSIIADGNAGIASSPVVFTIQNLGNATLTITSATLIAGDTGDFDLTNPASLTVAAGGNTTFTISFDPLTEGSKSATVIILNNDPVVAKSTYTFQVTGTGTMAPAPHIQVKQGSFILDNGTGMYTFISTLADGDGGTTSGDVSFAIRNIGTADLTITSIALTSGDMGDFDLTDSASHTITAGGSTSFQIRFDPFLPIGTKTAMVTILNNDPIASTFTFQVTGTALAPDIHVKQGSTELADGTGTYGFGSVTADANNGATSSVVSFIIENQGNSGLTISSIALTAGDVPDFDLTNSTSSPVSAGGNTTFTVRFDPLAAGNKSVTVTIQNSDLNPNKATYTFLVTGTGIVGSLASIISVTIGAGGDSFIMGDGSYGPNESQSISYNFKMSKYEITNTLFAQFIGDGGYNNSSYWTTNGWNYKQSGGLTQPALWTNGNINNADQPVIGISWYETVAFCNWRSVKEGLTKAYDSWGEANLHATGYRLPTEVEWEYAAAKGAPGQAERIYAYGNTWAASKVVDNSDGLSGPADVGSLSPDGDTPQGLSDMSGNVWEWCGDNWQSNGSVASGTDYYYFTSDSTSLMFVLRGGSWGDNYEFSFRSSCRSGSSPNNRNGSSGFRVVRWDSDGSAPNAPSALAATSSQLGISLTWTDNSNNEQGFKIERSPDGTSGWTEVYQTMPDAMSWTDATAAIGSTYWYRVRAFNPVGDSAYSNTANATRQFAVDEININAAGDSFIMGDGSYGPNVTQAISYNYKMSKYEVTNALFAQFIADGGYSTQSYWTGNGWAWKASTTQPEYWTDSSYNGPNQPVVGVGWYEAVAFCNWLSLKQGLTPAYDSLGHANLSATGYRLPTEGEWEYAAAKGAPGQAERIYAYGNTWDTSKVVDSSDGLSGPANVGSLSPAGDTPQGLADMSGNVWEWCGDNWQSDGSVASGTDRYYFTSDSTSQSFILRGGSWGGYYGEYYFRSAFRLYLSPGIRYGCIGFRVVRR
jgi:formylglycine-generating enzyme required for sulfatase activity